MARNAKMKVPKRIMGTKIPKDVRRDLKRLIKSIEGHGVAGLIAVAVSTWLLSKLNAGTTRDERDRARAH